MTGRRARKAFARKIAVAAARAAPTVPVTDRTPTIGPDVPPEERAAKILSQMTLEEKIDMLGGVDHMGIRGNERFGLATVWCSDASSGVRCFGPGTSFPALIAMTASWNRELIRRTAEAIADECRAIGVSILLGPGVNIYRVPTCGRNFEYMGEDPHLSSQMVVPYILGVQSRGVAATVKHFACNNSDYDRHRMNSVMDERTMREIYLPAFRAAVEQGRVRCLMSSYNLINGTYASENAVLLADILKKEWGFGGFVMSDWNSVYSTLGPVNGGLDLEMPRGVFMSLDQIVPLIEAGRVTPQEIDDKVRRMLTVFFEMGFYDRPTVDASRLVGSEEQLGAALAAAREAVVLLKNEGGLLPLEGVRRLVLLGRNATETPTGGGGSSHVPSDPTTIEQGLRAVFGPEVTVEVASDRRGRLGRRTRTLLSEADAVIVCAGFDHVLESESYDRSWQLPDGQSRLIRQAGKANPNTIVVLTAGGGVETASWMGSARAVLHSFYLGTMAGTAVAEVLSGRVNPSGKLPFTIARRWEDHPATANYVRSPGRTSGRRVAGPKPRRRIGDLPAARLERMRREDWPVRYEEGIFLGYRHFDARGIAPRFPFGFGLSYTTFTVSDMELSTGRLPAGGVLTVSVNVTNTGERAGAEVVQLYVEDEEAQLPRPLRELAGFEKVSLEPGESRRVSFSVGEEALRYYDPSARRWTAEAGSFRVRAGTSSRNLPLEAEFRYEG